MDNAIRELTRELEELSLADNYNLDTYITSLIHQTSQLNYFYNNLANGKDIDSTFYRIPKRPKVHQLAYFNIGRGFPKELMDGHWCYVLKDYGYKMLVIPCTSKRKDDYNDQFNIVIDVLKNGIKTQSVLSVTDIRCVDVQRLDIRKEFITVLENEEYLKFRIQKEIF